MIKEHVIPTLVAEATRIQGNLNFFAPAHIFGVVEGNLRQQVLEALWVGRSGWIHGSIFSLGPIFIEGRVDGDILSRTKVKLLPTASVRGKVIGPKIEICSGAILDGEISMQIEVGSVLKQVA